MLNDKLINKIKQKFITNMSMFLNKAIMGIF